MRKYCVIALTVLCLWYRGNAQTPPAAAASQGSDQNGLVMTVGARQITVAELCAALERLPPPQRKGYALHPALAKDWYGPLVALVEEAKRRHLGASLDNSPQNEVDLDNALVGELIQSIAKDAEPDQSEIERYYQTHKSEFEQVKARHILISDANALGSRFRRSSAEAKAERIIAQLRTGHDFALLAAKESDDVYTKSRGGDLGYVSHHQLEPAIDAAVWSLARGTISDPLAGRFGYEVVQVEDRRTQPVDAVRASVIGKIKAATLERRQQEIVAGVPNTKLACDIASELVC
jgi:parvulin-like peptidyl-prolyl cis-trans isomerase-like protein